LCTGFFGHSQFIFNRPDAIQHVLVENPGNYVRTAPTIRVLRPIFGRGLFPSMGEGWKQQRRTGAPAFAPRAVGILARHVAAAWRSLAMDLRATNNVPIQLVPVLQRLALEVIGSAMFSLEMKKYGAELRDLIFSYSASLGRPTLLDLALPLQIPTPCDLGRWRFRRRWIAPIRRIIAEREQRGRGRSYRDLFDLLVAACLESEAAAAEHLADQIATIVVAGHETTAAALFWSLYQLASAPDEQDALAAEAASLGNDDGARPKVRHSSFAPVR
jgi:cytochrome P450